MIVLIGAFLPISLSKKLDILTRDVAILYQVVSYLAAVILLVFMIHQFAAVGNPYAHIHLNFFSDCDDSRSYVFFYDSLRFLGFVFGTVAWKFLAGWVNCLASSRSGQQ